MISYMAPSRRNMIHLFIGALLFYGPYPHSNIGWFVRD